jgi:S-adenosylmethionine decarboxylase
LFGLGKNDYFEKDLKQIEAQLRKEMKEIYYGRNTGSL